jgi:hypothetical protein
MKTTTIRLPDVEAAMLVEVHKADSTFRQIDKYLVAAIRSRYAQLRNTQM